MDPLDSVLKDLELLYTQLNRKLIDPNASDNPLSRKSISQLSKYSSLIQQTLPSHGLSTNTGKSSRPKQTNPPSSSLLPSNQPPQVPFHLSSNHLLASLLKNHDENSMATALAFGW